MRSRLSRIGRVLNFGLAGDAALADLREGLEHDEWTRKVVNEMILPAAMALRLGTPSVPSYAEHSSARKSKLCPALLPFIRAIYTPLPVRADRRISWHSQSKAVFTISSM
jgi:hypothetical protein